MGAGAKRSEVLELSSESCGLFSPLVNAKTVQIPNTFSTAVVRPVDETLSPVLQTRPTFLARTSQTLVRLYVTYELSHRHRSSMYFDE